MTYERSTDGAGSVAAALEQVKKEITQYEAKKLGDLKTELEAVVKKQDDAVKKYDAAKYDTLRKEWMRQQQCIEKLHQALKCAYPAPPSEDAVLNDCVCTKLHELWCLERRIAKRRRCCTGERERARDAAKARATAAAAELDALLANAQGVEAALADDDKLIKQIQGLLSGPDEAVVRYLFWFKLLPAHRRLMPNGREDYERFDDETPAKLCAVVWAKPCEEEPGACRPLENDDDEDEPDEDSETPTAPWLIEPSRYRAALDEAWQASRAAAVALAQAEAEYAGEPDDLAALGRALEARRKAIDAEITDCLKNANPAQP